MSSADRPPHPLPDVERELRCAEETLAFDVIWEPAAGIYGRLVFLTGGEPDSSWYLWVTHANPIHYAGTVRHLVEANIARARSIEAEWSDEKQHER